MGAIRAPPLLDYETMTDTRSDHWGDLPVRSDLDLGPDSASDAGLGPDASPLIVDDLAVIGAEPEVDVDDIDLDLTAPDQGDGGDPADDALAARMVRLLRAAAVVGAAGFVIVLVINLLSPSNLLDTTGPENDQDDLVIDDEQAGIGGAPIESITGDGIDDGSAVVAVEGVIGGGAGEPVSGLGEAATASVEAADGTAEGQGAGAAANAVAGTGAGSGSGSGGAIAATADYRSNLAMIKAATVRNRNHDGSADRAVPQASLVLADHYGPRSAYLGNPGGNPEQSFPVVAGGQFRTSCEFSHFGYDDPLVFPGQAGASHLHMFFGNTDVNAYSTHDTLINSGSSTCNGQELNRTGYWVPAMFDGQGNVRVPERIVVYYKGEGRSRGAAQPYPAGAAMIATTNLDAAPSSEGGVGGKKLSFQCSDNFSTNTGNGSQTMASCDGNQFAQPGRWTVLEMNVKFPQCWNGQNPSDWNNFRPPQSDWYGSNCTGEFGTNLPNLEYFVNYKVDPGENTANWYLSSDVDPTSFGMSKGTGGGSTHGDWWGGWHPDVNRMFIDNCVNRATGSPSGCGMGYLTDGGPNGSAPASGPALKFRPQYEGPHKVSAAELFAELCPSSGRSYQRPEDAAYCRPG